MARMLYRTVLIIIMLNSIALGFVLIQPASADLYTMPPKQPTPFLTPTPGPDGKIIYIVQEGDTLWDIAAIAGITIEELMSRNGIQPDDYITPGMQLELGLGVPLVPTFEPGFEPTETPIPVSPTPLIGTGEICVLLYLDENGNAQLEEGEGPLPNGQISVADVSGAVAGEHTTDLEPEGHCFTDLMFGDYNVSVAIPPDHNPTMGMNVPVRLAPGDIKHVSFGAQPSSAAQGNLGGGESDRSTLMGLLGVVLLLAGGVLGYFTTRLVRGTPRSFR